jgi:hypothetical protein
MPLQLSLFVEDEQDGVLLCKTPMPKSGRTPDFGTRKGLQRYPFADAK